MEKNSCKNNTLSNNNVVEIIKILIQYTVMVDEAVDILITLKKDKKQCQKCIKESVNNVGFYFTNDNKLVKVDKKSKRYKFFIKNDQLQVITMSDKLSYRILKNESK